MALDPNVQLLLVAVVVDSGETGTERSRYRAGRTKTFLAAMLTPGSSSFGSRFDEDVSPSSDQCQRKPYCNENPEVR